MKNPLQLFRTAAGLSQADTARKLGVSTSSYSRYENNEVPMTADIQNRLAGILGVHPDFIAAKSGRAMCGGPLARAIVAVYRNHNHPRKPAPVNSKPAAPAIDSRLQKRLGTY